MSILAGVVGGSYRIHMSHKLCCQPKMDCWGEMPHCFGNLNTDCSCTVLRYPEETCPRSQCFISSWLFTPVCFTSLASEKYIRVTVTYVDRSPILCLNVRLSYWGFLRPTDRSVPVEPEVSSAVMLLYSLILTLSQTATGFHLNDYIATSIIVY